MHCLDILHCSTDALTFESVGLLVLFAILSLVPGLYRNREAIGANFRKVKERFKNCCDCCNNEVNNDPNELTSRSAPHSAVFCNGARTSDEETNMCQRKPISPQPSP